MRSKSVETLNVGSILKVALEFDVVRSIVLVKKNFILEFISDRQIPILIGQSPNRYGKSEIEYSGLADKALSNKDSRSAFVEPIV